jgi:hypothetical protein
MRRGKHFERMERNRESSIALGIGHAVIDVWGSLAREAQEAIFEQAVARINEAGVSDSPRVELAVLLHENHPRTEAQG